MDEVRTFAVVSCYRPGRDLIKNLESAVSQTDGVVVVDDASGVGWSSLLHELEARPTVTVARHDKNLGIARTLNDGVDLALSKGATHLLFLDQDSALLDGFVLTLLALLDRALAAGFPAGAVAPWFVDGHAPNKPSRMAGEFQIREEPIQSGLLMPVSTWRAVGRFREEFFIDCVDTEHYLRMRDRGLLAVFDRTLDLPHSLGTSAQATMLGRPVVVRGREVTVRVHPPWRTYYIYRNGLTLARERVRSNPRFALGWAVGMIKRAVISVGLGPEKRQQVRAIVLGTLDALGGRLGKSTRRFPARRDDDPE